MAPRACAATQARKRNRPRATRYASISLTILGLALCYSLTVNLLSIFPSTSCLYIAGGEGCDADDADPAKQLRSTLTLIAAAGAGRTSNEQAPRALVP